MELQPKAHWLPIQVYKKFLLKRTDSSNVFSTTIHTELILIIQRVNGLVCLIRRAFPSLIHIDSVQI